MSRKEKREETKKHESEPKKIVIKLPEFKGFTKKQIFYAICIVCALLVVLCIINYTELGLVLNKNITDEDVVKVDLISSNNKIYSYYNEVLIANSDGLSTYNKYGRETWKVDMQGAVDTEINTSGKFLQVINSDKSIVYIYNDKYETAQIRIEGTILSGSINEKGDSVIEYTNTGNKTVLSVYDKNGNAKYNVKLNNNMVGQYVLSGNSKYLAYVNINVSGISVSSTIQLVKFKGKNQESLVDEVAVEENSLVYEVYFEGDNLIYRTDKSVVSKNINAGTIKNSSVDQEGIVSLDLYDNKFSYAKLDNGKYLLGIKTIGGKEKKEIEITELPKYYFFENGKVYVCYQKEMCIYNSFKMKIKEYKSEMVITRPVILGEGNNIAFLVSNKLIIYSI